MNPDLLLALGIATVAWTIGVTMSLPAHVTDAAIQLGELHNAHEEAKQHQTNFEAAKYRVNAKLAAHIEQLKKLFSWE